MDGSGNTNAGFYNHQPRRFVDMFPKILIAALRYERLCCFF
jgi:hypothetical protein